jgi:short subunit dehydrogenase-like uncharacterized protein
MNKTRAVDIAIFGATGFTGQLITLELARQLSRNHSSLPTRPPTFAVVGRSRDRLNQLVAQVRSETDYTPEIRVLIADAMDPSSLRTAAAAARVLISAAGPFSLLGAPVLEACLEEGTDYADITGEPFFMELAELNYHERAKLAGVLIVPSCGFDSVPADVGVSFARETMRAGGATATAVESYLSIRGGPAGLCGHYATLQSAVLGLSSVRELQATRAAFSSKFPHLSRLPRFGSSLPRYDGPFWSKAMRNWAMPFMGSDASVVRRTQRSLVDAGAEDALPVQYSALMTIKNSFWLFIFMLFGALLRFLVQWSWGRSLVLSHPRFFTFGAFSHEGPNAAQLASTTFSMTFFASGTFGSVDEVRARGPNPSNSRATVRISGPEPGYVATPLFLLAAAYELLERERCVAVKGGVLTPAAAFRGPNSRLQQRLELMGIKFEVIDQCASLK